MKNRLFRLPSNVNCTALNNSVIIEGPSGKLKVLIFTKFQQKFNAIRFARPLTWNEITQLKQAIVGVSLSYTVELQLKGIGFKAEKVKDLLVLKLGYSHLSRLIIPSLITVSIIKNSIHMTSASLNDLKSFSGKIRCLSLPDCYKGQGIIYKDEITFKKEGKKI